MRLLRALPLLLVLLVGCPDPPDPGPGPDTSPPTSGPVDDGTGDGNGDGNDGDTAKADEGPWPARAPQWKVIPEEILEAIYPSLQPVARWPDPAGMTPLAELKDPSRRPSPAKILQLKQLVDALLHPSLQPSDLDAALALDADGNLHMRIGRSKTLGSACMDMAESGSPFPLFAVTLLDKADKARTITMLRAQVKRAVNVHLANELEQEQNRLEGHPRIKGKQIAALAFLDRNGYGMQFPYLYAFANGEHLTLVFQEVPHMTEPGTEEPAAGD